MKTTILQTIAIGIIAGLVASSIQWVSVGQFVHQELWRLELQRMSADNAAAEPQPEFVSSGHPSSMPGVMYVPDHQPTGFPPGYSSGDITDRKKRSPPVVELDPPQDSTSAQPTAVDPTVPALITDIELSQLPDSTVPSMVPGIIYEPAGGSTVPSMVPGIIYEAAGGSTVPSMVPGIIYEAAGDSSVPAHVQGIVDLRDEQGQADGETRREAATLPKYTPVIGRHTSNGPQGVPGIIYHPRKEPKFGDGVWGAIVQRQIEKLSWYVVRSLTRQALP